MKSSFYLVEISLEGGYLEIYAFLSFFGRIQHNWTFLGIIQLSFRLVCCRDANHYAFGVVLLVFGMDYAHYMCSYWNYAFSLFCVWKLKLWKNLSWPNIYISHKKYLCMHLQQCINIYFFFFLFFFVKKK